MDYLNDQRTEYDLALHLLRIQLDDDSYENIATNPVSYTHLDVYKRQDDNSFICDMI